MTSKLLALSLMLGLAGVVGCPTSDDDDDSGSSASCGDNHSDGSAAPTNTQALTLGTASTASVCTTTTGYQYYYWKATGTFADTDKFTLDLKLNGGAAGDSVTCYVGSAGTYSQSSGTTTVNSTTATDQTTDITPIATGGSSAVYVICYASAASTDVKSLSVEVKLTKQP